MRSECAHFNKEMPIINGIRIAMNNSEVIEMNLYVPVGLIVLILLIVFLVRGF